MRLKNYLTEKTNNEYYGLFGTLRSNYDLKRSEAHKVFDHFEKKLKKEFKGHPNMARDFLDSKSGRHFADDMSFFIETMDEPTVKQVIKAGEASLKKRGLKWHGVKRFAKDYDPKDYE